MSDKDDEVAGVSRRTFLKAGPISALGVASAGLLVADAQAAAKDKPGCVSSEKTPVSIPASQIVETITTDVVVVGAGVSGVIASLSAREAGAEVVVLQKGSVVMCHGNAFGAIDTQVQKSQGVHINKLEAVNEFVFQSFNKPNFRLVKKWADHSGEAFDWVNQITTEKGLPSRHMSWMGNATGNSGSKYWFSAYATGHTWKGGIMAAMNKVAEKAVEEGVKFFFRMPAVQLVREKNGRVSGVIAKSEVDGKYRRFNGEKGVILCTGDYGNNAEMVAKYAPSAVGLGNYYLPRYNTGDGHLMGLWIGAEMEPAPHTKMAHVHSSLDFDKGDAPGRATPWLAVQKDGRRFCNEDIPFYLMGNQTAGAYYYHIIDSDWEANLKQFPPRVGNPVPLTPLTFAAALKAGTIIEAASIEELATKCGIDKNNLVATVARYNEIVDKGVDEDFGKIPADLSAIRKGPFYCIPRLPCISVILGGLNINTEMQVLDKSGKVIEGLYAAGNVSGGYYGGADDYPFAIVGGSIGRAGTFGRIAGKNAAKSKV